MGGAGMVWWSRTVAGLAIVAAMVAPGGAGGASHGAFAAPPITASTPEPPQITLERANDRVVAGKSVTYRITVTNRHPDDELATTVRASVPPRLGDVSAADAQPSDGYLTWQVTVAPQQSTTLRLTGTYDRVGAVNAPDRVALTACLAHDDGQLLTCATDVATIVAPSRAGWWLGGAALAALAAAALWAWRQGRLQPPWDWRRWRHIVRLHPRRGQPLSPADTYAVSERR